MRCVTDDEEWLNIVEFCFNRGANISMLPKQEMFDICDNRQVLYTYITEKRISMLTMRKTGELEMFVSKD